MRFINELFARFRMESPSFFKVIQRISIVATALAGLPMLITQFQTELGLTVPDWIVGSANKIAVVGGILMWFTAKLVVKDPNETTEDANGDIVRKLKFTQKYQ